MTVTVNDELNNVLERCMGTASWFGEENISIRSVNLMDDTPLHTVCSWGEVEPVKTLLQAGADVNARGDLGSTPLFNAVIGGNENVVKLLLSYGANKNLRNDENWSVLEYAESTGSSKAILESLGG